MFGDNDIMKYAYILIFTMLLLIYSNLENVYAKPSSSISLQNRSAQVYADLGKEAIDAKDFQKAKLFFLEASRLNQNDESNFVMAGFAAVSSSEYDEAIRLLKKAIAVRPDAHSGYLGLGTAYNLTKRYEEAIAAFQKAVMVNSKCYLAQIALTNIFYKTGKHEECCLSIKHFNNIVDNLNYSCLPEREKRIIEKAKNRFTGYLTDME
jgi:tetratricopeptide (TPR) repeat protein